MAAHRRLALLPVAVGVASCLWQQMNGHLHRSSPFLEQAHVGTQPHALCCRSCLAGLSWCCATSSPAAQGRRRKRRLQWLRRQRRCGAAASSTTTDCSALAAGRCPHTGEGVGRGSMVGTEKAALRQQAALLVLTAAKLRGVAASQAACSHPSRPPPASPPPPTTTPPHFTPSRIGQALLRGQWREAVRQLLTPRPDCTRPEQVEAARLYLEEGDIEGALAGMPRFLVAEPTLLQVGGGLLGAGVGGRRQGRVAGAVSRAGLQGATKCRCAACLPACLHRPSTSV